MSRSILMLRDNSSVHNVTNRAWTGEGGHEVTTPECAPVGGLSKLVMDRCGAALLLLLAPLFLVLTLLIRRDGGAALFRHQRLGANGQMFPCMKFRTMVADADKVLEHLLANDPVAAIEWRSTQKLRHDPRITSVGHFRYYVVPATTLLHNTASFVAVMFLCIIILPIDRVNLWRGTAVSWTIGTMTVFICAVIITIIMKLWLAS